MISKVQIVPDILQVMPILAIRELQGTLNKINIEKKPMLLSNRIYVTGLSKFAQGYIMLWGRGLLFCDIIFREGVGQFVAWV